MSISKSQRMIFERVVSKVCRTIFGQKHSAKNEPLALITGQLSVESSRTLGRIVSRTLQMRQKEEDAQSMFKKKTAGTEFSISEKKLTWRSWPCKCFQICVGVWCELFSEIWSNDSYTGKHKSDMIYLKRAQIALLMNSTFVRRNFCVLSLK